MTAEETETTEETLATTGEPDPEPEPSDPPPPPPPAPSEPLTFQPAMWYSVDWTCKTVGCVNENTVGTDPLVYSNAGTVRIVCGPCGKDTTLLAATLLDPQPEMS